MEQKAFLLEKQLLSCQSLNLNLSRRLEQQSTKVVKLSQQNKKLRSIDTNKTLLEKQIESQKRQIDVYEAQILRDNHNQKQMKREIEECFKEYKKVQEANINLKKHNQILENQINKLKWDLKCEYKLMEEETKEQVKHISTQDGSKVMRDLVDSNQQVLQKQISLQNQVDQLIDQKQQLYIEIQQLKSKLNHYERQQSNIEKMKEEYQNEYQKYQEIIQTQNKNEQQIKKQLEQQVEMNCRLKVKNNMLDQRLEQNQKQIKEQQDQQKERQEVFNNKYNDLKYYIGQLTRQELEDKVFVLYTNYVDLKYKIKYMDGKLLQQNDTQTDGQLLKNNYEEIKQKYQLLIQEVDRIKRQNEEWKQKINDLDEFVKEHEEMRQKMVGLYVVAIDYISQKANEQVIPFKLNIEAITNGSKPCLKQQKLYEQVQSIFDENTKLKQTIKQYIQ